MGVYTKEKLFRFGLNQDPLCPRCQQVETLRHKFIECDYVRRIWDVAHRASNRVTTNDIAAEDPTKAALGAFLESNVPILTLYAEILLRINHLREDNYLRHPRFIVRSALELTIKRERKEDHKAALKSICGFFG